MTPKERFQATLKERSVDRIPLDVMSFQEPVVEKLKHQLGVNTKEEVYRWLSLDFRSGKHWHCLPPEFYRGSFPQAEDIQEKLSYWGTSAERDWKDHARPYGTAIGPRPLKDASSSQDVQTYPWPDPGYFDYQSMTEECKKYQDFVVRMHVGPLFCRLAELCGMETALENLLLKPKVVEAITERLTDFYCEVYRRFFTVACGLVDVFDFWDDVATDRGLFFSASLWRKFYKKPLARIFSVPREFGVRVQYHCCGAMSELIPDLLDIGMEILEPCQFHLPGMDPQRLKREFSRDLTFYGGICTQWTLPFGTEQQVRQEVRERISVLGRGGGYILAPDHSVEPDVPLENILAMYHEAKRYKS